ncbi:hypothetical protein [Kosakonia phage Kc237]|nr:hypothetical protein [Kosakonia phage Kc237]
MTTATATNKNGQTLADLRAKYWGNQPGTIFARANKAQIVSPLLLAQAQTLAFNAQCLTNRLRMWAAGPEAVKATKREIAQMMADANDALRGAYGR